MQRLACHDESCPSWACQPVLLSRDLGYLLLANLSSCGKPRVRYQGPKAAMQHSTETRERTSSSSSYMKACGWIVLSTNRMVSPPCFSASLSSCVYRQTFPCKEELAVYANLFRKPTRKDRLSEVSAGFSNECIERRKRSEILSLSLFFWHPAYKQHDSCQWTAVLAEVSMGRNCRQTSLVSLSEEFLHVGLCLLGYWQSG